MLDVVNQTEQDEAMANEVVPGLGAAIEARRRELGMSPGQLVERTGLTAQGLDPIRKGIRRQYQERLTLPLCRVLEWTPDSIDRLLRGEPPMTITQAAVEADELLTDDELAARLEAVGKELDRLQALADKRTRRPKPRAARASRST